MIKSGECFNGFNAYNQEEGFSLYRQESEIGWVFAKCKTCESQDQVQAYHREYPENQEIKMTLSMMPSLCRVQAVLTLVLTIIACQVDISLSHLLFCVGFFYHSRCSSSRNSLRGIHWRWQSAAQSTTEQSNYILRVLEFMAIILLLFRQAL